MTIGPRKTLTSQKWLRRNDSSSVSILLKPDSSESTFCKRKAARSALEADASDSDDEQPRRTILSALQSVPHPQHQIFKTFCPECYCKSFPVAPCLDRPRDACCCQQTKNRNKPTRCKQKVRVKSAPQWNTSMKFNNFTPRRESYEVNTKDYFTCLKQRLAALERELQQEQEEIKRKHDEYRRMQQTQPFNTYCTAKTCPKRRDREKETKINEINDVMSFRKAHYFACHSSATSLENASLEPLPCTNSTCIHKCYLDKHLKLHPKPEHCDEYGTSRCVHCQRALSQETLSHPPATISRSGRSLVFAKSSLDNFNLLPYDETHPGEGEEAAESVVGELQDKMFLTTRNNEKLEVTLPHNFLHEAQKPITLSMLRTHTFRNFKMPIPADSMALRYQKGMRHKVLRNK